jgi:hypothetical protein
LESGAGGAQKEKDAEEASQEDRDWKSGVKNQVSVTPSKLQLEFE